MLIPPANDPAKIPERVYGCTFSVYRQPELPLLYVAAALQRQGHDVFLRDFTEHNSYEEFEEFIRTADAGIYVIHTVLLAESADTKAAKTILDLTDARIIFFGPHPTLNPGSFLLQERCYVARGEAEHIICNLVDGLQTGRIADIAGISYVERGSLRENATSGVINNLDVLAFPERGLLPDSLSYFNPKLRERPVTLVLTSRGCSFRCYYCVPNAISWAREIEWKRFNGGRKPPVMLRSAINIVEEFRVIKSQGYKAVSVVDDMFLFGGKGRILELCEGLQGVGLPFGALSRCEFVLDREIVAALARAGCLYMDLGVESLDQGVLNDIGKDLDVRKVRKAIDLLNSFGIEPKPNIMFGASPMESRETIDSTVGEVSGYSVNYCMFVIATPFPGTEFEARAKKEGWLVEPEIYDLEKNLSPTDKSLVSYPHLKKEDLEAAVKKANRSFYLNPRRILFQLKKVTSLKALKDLITTGWKIIR